MGEESKHKILKTLLNGEMCACEIPQKIGRTQSNTFMHLAKLVEFGLVKSRRDGRRILYAVKDGRINKMFKIIDGR